ncbi:DegV family protein [Actinomadura luteofluorescens]|uniref:DegV family protein n=1 Tax=Actinomadura luteofluorescens TaxID=46163 RepID=UPI00362D8792
MGLRADGETAPGDQRRPHRAAGEGPHVLAGAGPAGGTGRGRGRGLRVDLGVQHLAAAARAEALAARLRERVPHVVDVYVGEVGPVIGAHVGPGMLGVVIAPQL